MSIQERDQQAISKATIKRIGISAGVGGVIEGAREYANQRDELQKEIPLEEASPVGRVQREVVIFHAVDKRKVGKAVLKGAAIGGLEEVLRSRREERQPQEFRNFAQAA